MIYDRNGHTVGQNLANILSRKNSEENNSILVDQAQKMYDYYKNDRTAILYYLACYLGDIYNEKTLEHIRPVWLNYVPRIIKRLALVYKKPATRYINAKNDDKNYLQVNRNLNKYAKEFHRQAKLLNTILVRPIYNPSKKMFDYIILGRNLADVTPKSTNYQEIDELVYAIPVIIKGKEEAVNVHWTETEHYVTDTKGKEIFIEGISNEGNKNPYGRIPFAVLRLEDSADFWGDGLTDLVDGNESLNARLTDTFFKLWMSFGVPVGTNLGIKADEFALGPDFPLMRDDVKADEVSPDLKFVTPEHKVELDKIVNDWFKSELGTSKGLPASAFSQSEIPNSGYAKTIDNLELTDLNEDDKDVLREFETDLFELQKKELEVSKSGIKFPEGEFKIEFAEIEFPKSDDEIWLNREKEYQFNISSPLDWLKSYRPNASEDELKAEVDKVKQFKATYDPQNTRKTATDFLQGIKTV